MEKPMDKIQIQIKGRTYNCLTDKSPESVHQTAKEIEAELESFSQMLRGKSETEIATITAFDIFQRLKEAESKIKALEREINNAKLKNEKMISESLDSANEEYKKIAEAKEQEHKTLLDSYVTLEKTFSLFSETKKEEIISLQEKIQTLVLANSVLDGDKKAEVTALQEEIKKLKLADSAASEAKKAEIAALQEENHELRLKIADLTEDGQLSLT